MSTRTMAIVSIEARILWLEQSIRNIESAYGKLKNKATAYAKEHAILLNCYSEVLGVYKWHYNRIVLSVNTREGEPDGETCMDFGGSVCTCENVDEANRGTWLVCGQCLKPRRQ